MTQTTARDEQIRGWFAGRLPDGWFTGAPEVTYDRDEILVVGTLPAPTRAPTARPRTERHAAAAARIDGHREDTRRQRMAIADEAERRVRPQGELGRRLRRHAPALHRRRRSRR